jgi:AraC family transcriptional regulator
LTPPLGPAKLFGMKSRVTYLFRSSTVEIVDWRCSGQVEAFAAEEGNDAHEIVVPRRGAYVRRVAGEDVFVDPGTVAFSHPGEVHRVRHPIPGGDACSAFRLAPSLAAELMRPTDPEVVGRPAPLFPASSAPLDGRIYLLHRLAVRAAADQLAPPLEVEERALAFASAAVASAGRPAVRRGWAGARRSRAARDCAARAREVIARRYRSRLTLTDIAHEVGCSAFHLSRVFTAVLGVPIHRVVLRLRLRDALERLLSTRDGVSAVAYATGFASHSHLTDAFRREYGCAPSLVRRLAPRDLDSLCLRARRH